MPRARVFALVLLLGSSFTQTCALAETAAQATVVTADTPHTTAHGHPFVVPADWSIEALGAVRKVSAPEPGSAVALIDVEAVDADAALAAAWAAYAPEAGWKLQRAAERPARGGWVRIRGYVFEAPAQRVRFARVARRGAAWNVAILDVAENVAETRDAQIELLLASLAPKGYVPETFAGRTARKLDVKRVVALRHFIESARQKLDVPGVAIGIVQDGRVVMAEGFGVRALGKPARVDADTRFQVASNTKALTTLLLAKLVDAGKFGWETPVTQVSPSFKLGDAKTTAEVRMKHLVCACTGLPRRDMEWIFEGERLTPDSVLPILATQQPTGAFGEHYQYSNLMAGAAGYIAGHLANPDLATGAAYDRAMQTLVFDPLGMAATTFELDEALRGNHAAPHAEDFSGKTVPASIELNHLNRVSRPDGGAWSNVNDLLRYVQMELASGKLPDGSRYVSAGALLARSEPQVSRGRDLAYGMGLKLDHSDGVPMIHHGGSGFGYISDMLWLPEHQVGAVILTNSEKGGSGLRNAFRRRLLEVLFDGEAQAAARVAVFAKDLRQAGKERAGSLRRPVPKTAAATLAPRYRSPELGDIVVTRSAGETRFDFGGWSSVMAVRASDAKTFVTISPAVSDFEFVAGTKGELRTLSLRDAQREYGFVEIALPD